MDEINISSEIYSIYIEEYSDVCNILQLLEGKTKAMKEDRSLSRLLDITTEKLVYIKQNENSKHIKDVINILNTTTHCNKLSKDSGKNEMFQNFRGGSTYIELIDITYNIFSENMKE